MKISLSISFTLLLCVNLMAQSERQNFFQGYVKEVSGKRFGYHSPLPDVNTSLLLRGMDDYEPIEWETEIVSKNYAERYATYIWVFGMDVVPDPVDFNLLVNDKHWFSFSSSRTSNLGITTFKGDDGAELSLNVTMLDQHEDQMGFAILKLPVKAIRLGQPTFLKVTTMTANNNAWFMTFKTELEQKTEIYQNKVVVKNESQLLHSISVDFIHIGEDASAKVAIGDIKAEMVLKAGFNKLEINLSKVEDTTNLIAEIQIADQEVFQVPFTLTPIKEWEIFLVQHTHTDVGYTRPQTEILPEHLRYIDHALDFCDQTDKYPDASKFRWTCETSWSVREYLKSRPKTQTDRLLQRIREGRIEATGMFLNFSEIIDESALMAQTKTLRMLKNHGIDVTTAMQNDVNGIAWCLVDYFHNTGVKYLDMGIHAHRARKPFAIPTFFWWQSPAGNRLLAYRSEHYQHGNALGITTGQQDVLRTNLSQYLTSLEEKGYPYDKISLQFSGYVTDNSPPSPKACDIIKEWNQKYEWPKLRSALARDFMIYLEEQHATDLPEQQVAWPDWWTDGVGSAANETKVARNTHMDIAANTAILSMAKILRITLPGNIQEDIDQVYDNLLFYDEHTHGAAESVSDPMAQNTINQWGMKSAYAWDAAKKSYALQEKALAYIEPALGESNLPTIAVFNTLNWTRTDMVELFIPYEVIPEGVDATIVDSDEREVPFQVFDRRMEGAYYGLWVDNIPPLGYKTLKVIVGERGESEQAKPGELFENKYYRLILNEKKGIVTGIFDKDLKKNLIDPNDSLTLGQMIYEELSNRHDLERLTNTNRDTLYRPVDLKRSLLSDIKVTQKESGAIYNSLFLRGDLSVCADDRGVTIEIRLYHFQKKIEFLYSMYKLPVVSPEGVYVAFPFNLDGGKLAFEAQGGVVYPGVNQLAGSSSDWNTIQNFAAVRNNESQIVMVSNDIPLVQFGAINIGRYYYRLKPKTNHIYSWVLNNYWVTNFKASQQGELRWTYSITSSKDNSDIFATKFGWGDRVPLVSRVILPSEGAQSTQLVSRSLIDLAISNLLLVNTTPSLDGKGIILQVREVEGNHAIVDIRSLLDQTAALSIQEVNVMEEELSTLTSPLLIEHFGTKFLKLIFER
ncbi:MAG: hypothetical protein O2887_16730 [Bacteroidetes bacterium]|nr:hypothetical protein [Bacteroidota bacterium]MDA1122107.1 hypothetical protein [Bacteroidota bacterium]